jgi:hypothetical protein
MLINVKNLYEKKKTFYGQTDRQTDGQTDNPSEPHKKKIFAFYATFVCSSVTNIARLDFD